jgi:aldehyde dehydrogenase (NAD+)
MMKKRVLKIFDIQAKNNLYASLYVGEKRYLGKEKKINCISPIDLNKTISYKTVQREDIHRTIDTLHKDFLLWREVPAPKRGLLVKKIGELVTEHKNELAYLITLESGKIFEEALGEVQEFIDMCDFALGLSRQLYGLSIASERQEHKMIEQWHPLGVIGVISAFNFPMAVWAWNAMLALVCGNTIIWKPSSQTPLCAIACHNLVIKALKSFSSYPKNLSAVALCSSSLAQEMLTNDKVRLVSATGSVAMGKKIAPIVAARLGKTLLELGGNNALIVTQSANLDLAIQSAVFSAVGTAGQRCTSLRRLFVHKKVFKKVQKALIQAYKSIPIGNPLKPGVLLGPLINEKAFHTMQKAIKEAKKTRRRSIIRCETLRRVGWILCATYVN